MHLYDVLREIIYEYADVCSIHSFYYDDPLIFDSVIQRTKREREFSFVNLTYLQKNYKPKPTNIQFEEVALKGNLDNMKWLKENGCPWGLWTFAKAAEFGNLENMKWLKENGCPWTSY